MAIIDKLKLGDALWYALTESSEGDGSKTFATPVAVKVRWTDEDQEVLMPDGTKKATKTKIWVGEVVSDTLTQADIKIGDYLLEGTEASSNIETDRNAIKIIHRKVLKNINQNFTYYKFRG